MYFNPLSWAHYKAYVVEFQILQRDKEENSKKPSLSQPEGKIKSDFAYNIPHKFARAFKFCILN